MKVLVLGIDGGSYNILDGFVRLGIMPNLRRVLTEGVRGELYVHANHRGWATLMTGLDPSHHGGFYWQRVAGTYGLNDAFSLDLYDDLAIWRDAERGGLTVGMAGMPTTFPPPELLGFVIANGGGGIGPANPGEAVYPAALLDEHPQLAEQRLDVRYADYAGRAPEDYFFDLIEIVRERSANCMALFDRHDPDLGILAFEGPDRMLHWFYDDVAAAAAENGPGSPLRDAIRDYFSALDDALGEACRQYADECPVYIVSDHGFVRHDWDLHINSVLTEAGLAAPARSLKRRIKERMMTKAIDVLPPGLRVRMRKWVRRNYRGGQARLTEPALDWTRTLAFGHSGSGVYVNRAGLQPAGIVSERDFDDVVRRIIDALAAYPHPETGEPLFGNPRDAREVYRGPRSDRAADVVFDLPPGVEVTRRLTDGPALARRTVPHRPEGKMPKARSGIHGSRAIFAAFGRGVPSGQDIGLRDMNDFRDELALILDLPRVHADRQTFW